MSARVAITGIGAVTPVGPGPREFWLNLLAGQLGFAPVESFDSSRHAAHVGAEVRGFDGAAEVRRLDPARLGRASLLACWLTGEFLRSAFVHYEIGIAESQGAKIVPLTVDPPAMQRAPAYLQAKQGIPVPQPVDYDSIAREIRRGV